MIFDEEKVAKQLLKKAMGYSVDEVVMEYVNDDDNNMKLVKKKVTKKHIPPDMSAVKTIIEKYFEGDDNLIKYSDEELNLMRKQILKEIKEGGVE